MTKNRLTNFISTCVFTIIFSATLHNNTYATENIVSTTINENQVLLEVNSLNNEENASVIIFNNFNNEIVYLDQSNISNNHITFQTTLDAGLYSGYISTDQGVKLPIVEFTIASENTADNEVMPELPNTSNPENTYEDTKNESVIVSPSTDSQENNIDSSINHLPVTGSIINSLTLGLFAIILGLILVSKFTQRLKVFNKGE